jgi:hypothetical protein
MGELAVLFAEAGHRRARRARVLPPDQGTDPTPLDPVVPVLPPWCRDPRGSWPA